MEQTKIYPENKELCLTPESKIEEWAKIIHETVKSGNIVKLYADIESTGFDYSNRGRGKYDPVVDKKMLLKDSATFNIPIETLEKEALELEGKIDRMIEFAFVACYETPNKEVYLLKDSKGEPIYFHEMINPNAENNIPESKRIKKMPLVPYEIHKTSFDFLEGKEEHPFLKVKLPHAAPSTKTFFEKLMVFLDDYENDELFDNIYMFFHNGDGFDVPFIDAELNRVYDGEITLRDIVQVYDTLDIAKSIIPSPIQKYISHCQSEPFYGGDLKIKEDSASYILPTSKSLDNIVRFAKFLIKFDPQKPFDLQERWQKNYYERFKEFSLKENLVWPGLEEYETNPSRVIDISNGLPSQKSNNIQDLKESYKKYTKAVADFNKLLSDMESKGDILRNFYNIKETIEENDYLKEALYRLNNTNRDAHGARVDSQLFMDAFIVIEGAFYPYPKLDLNNKNNLDDVPLKLPEEAFEIIKKKSEPSPLGVEHTVSTIKKMEQKYSNDKKLKNINNKLKLN